MKYTYQDMCEALLCLGVQQDDTVLVRADLRYLGPYENGSRQIPADWYKALTSVVSLEQGTIVTPTSTVNLCNTDIPFDPELTPSKMGALAEFIRTRSEAVRSFHPYLSYSAIGKNAKAICADTARHGFGPETPKARLIDMNAKVVSIGIPPNFSATTVHHVELMMGVPYRYVKEFLHPVVRNGITTIEPFYLYVWYRECELKRAHNKKIMASFADLTQVPLGNGHVACYNIADFYEHCIQIFKHDIYAWLEEEPATRPYRR